MIILGSITSFVGVFCFFFLIDNPKSPALSLNAEQEILVEERTRDNAVVRTTMIKKEHIFEALKEIRFWCLCFCCMLLNLQNGAMTTYSTQFAMGFGFTVSLRLLNWVFILTYLLYRVLKLSYLVWVLVQLMYHLLLAPSLSYEKPSKQFM